MIPDVDPEPETPETQASSLIETSWISYRALGLSFCFSCGQSDPGAEFLVCF